MQQSKNNNWVRLNVFVDSETANTVKEIASELGMTTSDLVRQILKDFTNSKKKELEEYQKAKAEYLKTRNSLL